MQAALTRRHFLGTATAAMATSALGTRPVSANSKLVLGVIGCGGIATADVGCFLQNPEIEIPVICDVDEAHFKNVAEMIASQRGKVPDTVRDFRRIIDRNDVDLLLVCTPDHWHALPTVYGCQAGKDVYVEKPLGRTIAEGRAMREAMRQNRRIVQMGTQGRSSQHYAEAVDFIQSGQLGKIRLVRAWAYLDWVGGLGNPPDTAPPDTVDYDFWLGPAPARPFNPNRFHFNFRWFWDYAGGLMTDWGVHLLNVCLWAMGPEMPIKVMSCGGKRVVEDNTETPDTQFTVYEFPSYALIWEHQMQGGLGPNGRPHGLYFSGSNGAVLIDDTGWEIIPEPRKDALKSLPRPEHEPPDHVFPAIGGIKRPAGRDPRARHVRNFLDCVASREQPVEHLAFAHQVSTVAHLGNIALRTNSEIHWDNQNERIKDNPASDALVFEPYRAPWTLPYAPR